MAHIIKMGDAYALPFTIKIGENFATPENIERLRISVGKNLVAYYPNGKISFRSADHTWLFPLTQEQSYRFTDKSIFAEAQVQFVHGETRGTNRLPICIKESNFRDTWGEKELTVSGSTTQPENLLEVAQEQGNLLLSLDDSGRVIEPVIDPLTVTENGTYEPEEGVDGFAPVTVNVPQSPQVQSDWNEADTESPAYIRNKPTIPSIEGLATEQWVSQQLVSPEQRITEIEDKIPTAASETNELADKAWVEAKGYLAATTGTPQAVTTQDVWKDSNGKLVTAAGGGEGAQELFWAAYGSSSFADVTAQLEANKVVAVNYNERLYYATTHSADYVYFAADDGARTFYLKLTSDDVWTNGVYLLQVTSYRDSTIPAEPSDAHYPSSAAVKTYVDDAITAAVGAAIGGAY